MMERDRVKKLIAAYGADRARWPEAEVARLGALAPHDPELAAAGRLDALLSRFEAPPVAPDLVERIVARTAELPQQRRGGFRWRRLLPRLGGQRLTLPGLPWPELAAMSAALVLGFYVGASGFGYGGPQLSSDQLAASTFGDAGLTLSTTSSPADLFQSGLFRSGLFQ